MTSVFDRFGVDEIIEITHGDYRAVLSPQGASLKTLHYNDAQIVTVPLPVTDFAFVGSALAPWANRLEDATWQLGDQTFQGEITEPGNHNGLHGLLVARDFEFERHADNAVKFTFQFGADVAGCEVYPFNVRFSVTYELNVLGLFTTFEATNHEDRDLPISFGAHPYFVLDENSELRINAHSAAINNSRQLPIGRQSIEAIGLKYRQPVEVANLELDDCVFDFEGENATFLSRRSVGLMIKVWQDSNLPYQMLFVRGPKFAGSNPVTMAIEPQSSPANALVTKKDLLWMQPGETVKARWAISALVID